MSIPEWTFKLEAAEFKRNYQPDLMISWLLNSPDAELMPDHVRKARLLHYGWQTPAEEPIATPVRKAGRPRKDATQ